MLDQITGLHDVFDLLMGEFALPVEANQLRLACQAVNSAVKPFALAIGFALTRTSLNSLSLTLRQWHDIWHLCIRGRLAGS